MPEYNLRWPIIAIASGTLLALAESIADLGPRSGGPLKLFCTCLIVGGLFWAGLVGYENTRRK